MIKYIDHHRAKGGLLEFDTESGSVQPSARYEWQNSPDWGCGWQQKGKWYVVHNDDESFILQAGLHVWRLTQDTCLKVKRYCLFLRQFRIEKKGQLLFSLWYIPEYFYMPLMDPAFEDGDEEDDDFFLYVVNIWNMWQNRDYAEFKRNIAASSEED